MTNSEFKKYLSDFKKWLKLVKIKGTKERADWLRYMRKIK